MREVLQMYTGENTCASFYPYICSDATENRARSPVLFKRDVMFFKLGAALVILFYLARAPAEPLQPSKS